MDQKLLRDREALCTQENPPRCMAECPVHVDVRGMTAAVEKGDSLAAFKLYGKAVPFPGIISRICEQPCRNTCLRKELDESVFIRALERFAVDDAGKTTVRIVVPPLKAETAAVVGSGLSGLTVARTLAQKGYPVTIYERDAALGGRLKDIPEAILPRAVLETDLSSLRQLPIKIKTETEVALTGDITLEGLLQECNAVYLDVAPELLQGLAPNLTMDEQGLPTVHPVTLETSCSRVFAGGSLLRGREPYRPIVSVSEGRIAANSMDRLMQNVSLTANRTNEGSMETQLFTSLAGEASVFPAPAADPALGYSTAEARQEAGRCLQCQCLECVKACVFLEHYRGYPKKYFREIYNNLSIVMGIHHANKMINTCSLCGLCAHICPNGADMGEMCHDARLRMVETGKMPPSAHDFALRDMAFSTGEHFALSRHQPGHDSSAYLFFPGCQLAGSAPERVAEVYDWLGGRLEGGVGLMLNCCGAPAQWAGQVEGYAEAQAAIRVQWELLGKPKIITACPSCSSRFGSHQPDMEVEMLYPVLDRIGIPEPKKDRIAPRVLAVHDSCSTRFNEALHASVRRLVEKAGHQVEELPGNRSRTTCCGFGGLMMFADKEVARAVVARRVAESSADYAVYCAMCRDNFARQGKRTFHLLDLLFGAEAEEAQNRQGPDYSRRHENRSRLKTTLLKTLWEESVTDTEDGLPLVLTDAVRTVLEERMILEEDIRQVLAHAEASGNRLLNQHTGRYTAYHQPACVTYWVEYLPSEAGYVIFNAYSHRLEIGE